MLIFLQLALCAEMFLIFYENERQIVSNPKTFENLPKEAKLLMAELMKRSLNKLKGAEEKKKIIIRKNHRYFGGC